MKPDQKYMPRDKKDLQFVQLNLQSPFHPSENGWMPVFNLNNESTNLATTSNSINIFTPNVLIRPFSSESQLSTLPNTTIPNGSMKNFMPNTNLYPSEGVENELYSYNKGRTYEFDDIDQISVENLLKEIDYSYYDFGDNTANSRCCNDKLNKIFMKIQNENSAILETLRSYKVPLPISKILIKKIINVSIENCDKE